MELKHQAESIVDQILDEAVELMVSKSKSSKNMRDALEQIQTKGLLMNYSYASLNFCVTFLRLYS